MLFSVIYSYDCPREQIVLQNCKPPVRQVRNGEKVWHQTELGPSEIIEGWAHRKYCAILTEAQLKDFVNEQGLHYDGDGSSLGAPGLGLGCVAAMVFTYGGGDADLSLNVTPFPEDGNLFDAQFTKLPKKKQWPAVVEYVEKLVA